MKTTVNLVLDVKGALSSSSTAFIQFLAAGTRDLVEVSPLIE